MTELDWSGLHQSTHPHVVGTVRYISPEQAAGAALSTPSDWYSVGVMLYQALTNRLPFDGSVLDILRAKQERDPTPPGELVRDLPDDLQNLCAALLRRSPSARPTGEEVLQQLGGGTSEPSEGPALHPWTAVQAPFVGREGQRVALRDAFTTMQQGQTVAVYVTGRSGVGKTALVQRFLEELPAAAGAVVLSGRCYEQESVPYKAFDNLIDALSRYLGRLPFHEVRVLLPREVQPLARVFPVLGQVEAVAEAPQPVREIPNLQELRRRAFAGLRELLARLGVQNPLVLVIDDLQWGDADSAALLADLLRPPDPPNLLFVGCYRSEDAGTSPFLRVFFQHRATLGSVDQRELEVKPLSEAESRQLVLELLEEPNAYVDRIVRESDGYPYSSRNWPIGFG